MKAYGFMVRSGLSGRTVHVEVHCTKGAQVGQYLVHLSQYGDTVGHTLRTGPREWTPTAYLDDGTQIELTPANSRTDAMRDIVEFLSDGRDHVLDLEWREMVAS